MTTARDVMTTGADFLPPTATVMDAANKLASGGYGALPICDGDRLQGMITDRDIVVKVLAQGKDPASTKVIDVYDGGEVVTAGPPEEVAVHPESAIAPYLERHLRQVARHTA